MTNDEDQARERATLNAINIPQEFFVGLEVERGAVLATVVEKAVCPKEQ